jgi:hypothetical protein
MDKTTFEEYKSAIRAQYEAKKTDGFYGSGDISNLTPAQLRNLCLRISENGLSKMDESTFRLFFKAKDDEKLGRAIDNFGTGKLKSVISFLKGEKNSESPTRIELASIIIDFNPRPFNKYRLNGGVNNITAIEISPVEDQNVIVSNTDDLEEFNNNEVITEDNNTIKKIAVFSMILLSLFFMGYTIKDLSFPTKECMQWEKNHYEAVDCSSEKVGIGQLDLVVPINEETLKLEKLDSKAALVFFKNDKPIVWYSKTDGVIELFNQSGFDPESEKPLKPITDYIIHKYKLKEK